MHFHAIGVPPQVHDTDRPEAEEKTYVNSDPLAHLREELTRLSHLIQAIDDCLRHPMTTQEYDRLINDRSKHETQFLIAQIELEELQRQEVALVC